MTTSEYAACHGLREGSNVVDKHNIVEGHKDSPTLQETLTEEAVKVGHTLKTNADYIPVTEAEKQRLDKQVFPDNLKLSSDVNLSQSKKAFLNLTKDLEDPTKFKQLWDPRPHNPHSYQVPIGM